SRTLPPPVRSSASLPPVMRSGPTSLSRSSIGTAAISRSMAGGAGLSQSTSALNSLSSLRGDGVPASSLSSAPSGPYLGGISGAHPLPSSSLSGMRSGAVALPRSGVTPPPSDSSRSLSSGAGQQRSITYRILIALLYLAAVSILVFSLLFDRSSCRGNRDRASSLPPAIGGP
ncbi:MAG TPA: hypothetical protein PK472_02650, partial [Pseudomonadota bacterium]|nr:hypothetical protein [Pseudomonadota bacterium]